MGMSYSSVNFRDELVSSSEGEDVLGQESYSSASTRTQEVYFNSSRNGGGWTCKATPTLKSASIGRSVVGRAYNGTDHSPQAWPGVKLMVSQQVELLKCEAL
ncbi:hypothetical protein PIB30_062957 [Stylosanthes scabra]|uniref:Transferrin-like domain-containing protein n=1 Tax=Stylosanthes scabra TaxID=79078 RepID=A0ABU6UK36_9FABA|nr:hypothetical protein [Stylosanthes scabra]